MKKLFLVSALAATAFFVACGEKVEPPDEVPDAGELVDAGWDYDRDGGGAINVLAASSPDSVALAWRAIQPGPVARWEVLIEQDDGVRIPVASTGPTERSFTAPISAGETRRYFIVGLNAEEQIVAGEISQPEDAGQIECLSGLDCAEALVCDLGQCRAQGCTDDTTCPTGYTCEGEEATGVGVCTRGPDYDAGTVIGEEDAGVEAEASLPFVSELIEVSAGTERWTAPAELTRFTGQVEDTVALDSAGQYVVLTQSGQLLGHRTDDRGQTWRPVRIDTLGSRAKLAFDRESRTLYACYNAGQGIRVRKSLDLGRTWVATVLEIAGEDPLDGGFAPVIQDCDVAAWTEGGALVAAIEAPGDEASVVVYTINASLELSTTDVAFGSTTAVFAPRNVALATDPGARRVHVVFTGHRTEQGGARDREIYGVRRDTTTGVAYSPPQLVSVRGTGGLGSPSPQDNPTVLIDPVTGRGVAAYVSNEPAPISVANTIYVSLFNDAVTPARWQTGTDLDVFEQTSATVNPAKPFLVLPQRTNENDPWAAFAPQLVVGPRNELLLYFIAGPTTGRTRYEPYVVGIDLNQPSPSSATALGWYLAPAQRISTERVFSETSGEFNRASFGASADRQISSYLFYTHDNGSTSSASGPIRTMRKP